MRTYYSIVWIYYTNKSSNDLKFLMKRPKQDCIWKSRRQKSWLQKKYTTFNIDNNKDIVISKDFLTLVQSSIQIETATKKSREGSNERFRKIIKSKDCQQRPRWNCLHPYYFQLLCMDVKVGQWRKLTGKKLISFKNSVRRTSVS